MNLTIISMFRTMSPSYMDRYFSQVAGLPADTHVISVEGDSADDTRARLRDHLICSGKPFTLVVHEHGGPHYGQVILLERFRQRAGCKNAGLKQVSEQAEAVIYVEGDLIWDAASLMSLVAQLRPGVDVIAPSVWARDAFYDIWGFRDLEGHSFCSMLPFSPSLRTRGLTEISAAGSCLAMRGEVARTCLASDDEEIVGFCKDARLKGYHIFTDWQTRIYHPC
jgi:hypothetical protein